MPDPLHIRPTADLAPRVILPGDPGRALLLAQALLDSPLMFNHNRGLWGYTGTAPDGAPLTIQSTGMGGPSAAVVVAELIMLGAERFLRVGTCGGLDGSLALGELLVAEDAVPADGTSQALGAEGRARATPALVRALGEAAGMRTGTVVSTDLFYEDRDGLEAAWMAQGALAVEMETATLFALAAKHSVEAGSLLIVSDVLAPERASLEVERLREAEQRAGEVAVRALAERT